MSLSIEIIANEKLSNTIKINRVSNVVWYRSFRDALTPKVRSKTIH